MAREMAYWEAEDEALYKDIEEPRTTAFNRIEKSLSQAKTSLEVLTIVQEEGIEVKALFRPDTLRERSFYLGKVVNILEDGTLFIEQKEEEHYDDKYGNPRANVIVNHYNLVQKLMPIIQTYCIKKKIIYED